MAGGVEDQLLHLTNPRENRFFSTRSLFHRYHSQDGGDPDEATRAILARVEAELERLLRNGAGLQPDLQEALRSPVGSKALGDWPPGFDVPPPGSGRK
jgi:hypothetical protein